jgi:hypothetical protein
MTGWVPFLLGPSRWLDRAGVVADVFSFQVRFFDNPTPLISKQELGR